MTRSFWSRFATTFACCVLLDCGVFAASPVEESVSDDAVTAAVVESVELVPLGSSDPPGTANWVSPRGDAGATGATSVVLPDDLVVLWETKLPEAIESTPVSDGQRVFVSDVMGGVQALSLTDGSLVWRKEFDTGFVASPALYLPASEVGVVGDGISGEVDGDDSSDKSNSDVSAKASSSADRTMLVVGDVEGNVYALDPATGDSYWQQTTDGEINASASFFAVVPTPASGDASPTGKARPMVRVLQTSQDGCLYCFDAGTGSLVWKYETGDQIHCAPSIGNGTTLLGGCDGGLHVVDLATGKAIREPIPLEGPTGSTPAIADGEVYLPIMDGVFYSFGLAKGEVRWQYEDPDRAQEYRGSAAIAETRVVVASRNKQVDAIDRATGKPIWRVTLRRRADASPLIAGNDVWIASTDGRLLRLSLEDGTERWSFEIRGGFFASPAIVDGRLVIADDEGVVRCFGQAEDE
ncbi:outer membrane protein assembly factor BamB family protein [Neorhodopirellula lusitana]|uniref:outer membrane protein assembly factor BamB family protein n=1 Tax=Neorhodopirellula lusitana TaxID=445327 RepID=UPI00384F4D11